MLPSDMDNTLPVHPRTGLRALGWTRRGPIWPVMGGDDTTPPPSPPADPPQDPPGTPPANPPQNQPAPPSPDRGFPEGTPVAEMTPEQQAAYWRDKARKHEDRARQAPDPAELKRLRDADKELERVRQEQMSDQEKAVEAARQEGEKAAAERFGERLVIAEFKNAAAGRVPGLDVWLEDLNHSKFLDDQGEPDAAAIKARVEALMPPAGQDQSDGDNGAKPPPRRRLDLEQGYRTPPANAPSVQGGADLYAKYKDKK